MTVQILIKGSYICNSYNLGCNLHVENLSFKYYRDIVCGQHFNHGQVDTTI